MRLLGMKKMRGSVTRLNRLRENVIRVPQQLKPELKTEPLLQR